MFRNTSRKLFSQLSILDECRILGVKADQALRCGECHKLLFR
jgi:hypothetical protein